MTAMYELQLERTINAPAALLYRAWTTPELIKQWFVPKPWGVASAEMDVKAGGGSLIVMQSPEGELFPNPGIYLEVIPNKKLVFTDAYTVGWVPSAKPFMTGIIEFEAITDTSTLYRATARHWTEADLKQHEAMGFYEGWGKATDQLEELVTNL